MAVSVANGRLKTHVTILTVYIISASQKFTAVSTKVVPQKRKVRTSRRDLSLSVYTLES